MESKKPVVRGFFMVLIAVCFWGVSFVWSKQLLGVMSPVAIAISRMAVASVSLIVLGYITKSFRFVKKRDLGFMVLMSLVQPFLYFLFELGSIEYNSPTLTALIIAQIPLFLALINYLFNAKSLAVNLVVGILVSLLGVVFVILGGSDISLIASPLGIVMAAGALSCAVIYNLLLQKVITKYSPVTITTYTHAISFLLFLPIIIITEPNYLSVFTLHPEVIKPLVLLGVFCSAMSFAFYAYGVKSLGIISSSMINNLSPAVTAVAVFILLGDSLSLLQVVGIAVTIVGLTVGLLKMKKK